MDSKTVNTSTLVSSLEASLILVVQQGEREYTGGIDLTKQSSRLRKDKCLCHDPCIKKLWFKVKA
jgi:hypothetical protein